jgi:hypothetical protein
MNPTRAVLKSGVPSAYALHTFATCDVKELALLEFLEASRSRPGHRGLGLRIRGNDAVLNTSCRHGRKVRPLLLKRVCCVSKSSAQRPDLPHTDSFDSFLYDSM